MDLREQKQRLRNAVKERLGRISPTDFAAESRTLCKQMLKHLPAEPQTICAYYPLKEEADIRMGLEELLKRGYRLYLPCFEDGKLAFRRAESLQKLTQGPFHIPEPLKSAETLNAAELQYALLPGRAFDKNGGRLGRGNGGYDKWLKLVKEKAPQAKIWGVALDCQLTNDVPMEAHDVRMNALLMARGLTECALPPAEQKR